jgi:hypothetical protein
MNIAILDSENIHTLTSFMLKDIDRIYIMTLPGQEKIKITLPCHSSPITISYIEIFGSGKNNMDQHIISLVGNLVAYPSMKVIRIISNDMDYFNVSSFWKKRGKNIEQFRSNSHKLTNDMHLVTHA